MEVEAVVQSLSHSGLSFVDNVAVGPSNYEGNGHFTGLVAGKTVLLVEDNEADKHIISSYLSYAKEETYVVTYASNILDGLEHIESKKFDIVLLDYFLPDGNALDFLENMEGQQRIPYILLSGAEQSDLNRRMTTLGVYDYISKSVLTPTLLEKVLKLALIRSKSLN